MGSPRVLLVVNRHARSGETQVGAATEALTRRGFTVIAHPTSHADETPHVVREHAREVDIVVLGGGDGTMNQAAEAVVESGKPLGILPLGTANDLARTLGIPTDVGEACAVIADGRSHRIDLGSVNGKLFFNVASIGMSVAITRRLSGALKRRWGVLGYGIGFMDSWRASRAFRARIRGEGDWVEVRSIQLAVGNGRFYGGGMEVAETARIDDGKLDLYSVSPIPFWRLAASFPSFKHGRHRDLDSILCLSAPRIELETDRPMTVNTDGELTTRTPARFEVVPHALSVFVPASDAPGLKGPQDAAA